METLLIFQASGLHLQAAAEDAIVDALRSAKHNCYGSTVGILPARKGIADYLNRDLPYQLSPDDVYITVGCIQAIEVITTVLSRPGANILLPRPGFPYYEARCAFNQLEMRHFDLLPERGWEVDLDAVESLADENTVAIVIINPGNPCGNVFSYQHLNKIAETAKKLGIMVISDEAYDNLTFGSTLYVPMRVFGSTVPVITLGSISKRWITPGWRLGWLVTSDPNDILRKSGVGLLILLIFLLIKIYDETIRNAYLKVESSGHVLLMIVGTSSRAPRRFGRFKKNE